MGSRLDAVVDWEKLAERAGYRVKELARLSRVDRRELPRYFGRILGCSPKQWLEQLRLRIAIDLLNKGEPACAVAVKLGFSQEASFYHFFLRNTGKTPIRYVKDRDADNAAGLDRANPLQTY